jgi:hypothetical protein
MKVVDVSNPSVPRTIGSLSGNMRGVAMAGQYAYVLNMVPGNPSHTDLVVVNLSVPTSPAIVGRVTLAGGNGVKVIGSLAYVAAGNGGLQVINISNPAAPSIVTTVATPEAALNLATANGYLYVAGSTRLLTYSLSNPQNPSLTGSLTVSGTALSFPAIAAAGSRVYEIANLSLLTIDVSNPAAPFLMSTTTNYGAQALEATGTTVLLARPAMDHFDPNGGVYIMDMSNASAPRLIKQVVVAGATTSVTVAPNYAYAGDKAAIIDVITLP